jgi:hypothetical protein
MRFNLLPDKEETGLSGKLIERSSGVVSCVVK